MLKTYWPLLFTLVCISQGLTIIFTWIIVQEEIFQLPFWLFVSGYLLGAGVASAVFDYGRFKRWLTREK